MRLSADRIEWAMNMFLQVLYAFIDRSWRQEMNVTRGEACDGKKIGKAMAITVVKITIPEDDSCIIRTVGKNK
jgi:hypothetical protein